MGKGGRAEMRVLVVYGSESGTAKRGIEKLVKKWKDGNDALTFVKVMEGNEASSLIQSGELKEMADALIVATSSFGEGDPPANFNLFLLELYRAAATNEEPLKGLQHAVLGFGASVYETFQNVPRLSDKLLEECGSRRMAQRQEVDEGGEEDPLVAIKAFEVAVAKALQALPAADKPAVCKWSVPGSQILEKTESDLNMGMDVGAGGSAPMLALAGLVALGGAAYAYSQGMF